MLYDCLSDKYSSEFIWSGRNHLNVIVWHTTMKKNYCIVGNERTGHEKYETNQTRNWIITKQFMKNKLNITHKH